MSYCRWSTGDPPCDVSVYAHYTGEWTTHVVERLSLPSSRLSFSDPSAAACADRLDALRAEGCRVPQSAIDALRAEVPDAE